MDGGDGTSSLNKITLNDEELFVENIRFVECSLTKEHVNVVLILSQDYKKKSSLFLEYSWLQHNKKLEDEDRVEISNKECCTLLDKLPNFKKVSTEDKHFEGRFDGTYDMGMIYDTGDYLICPTTKQILQLSKVEAVFLERMSSYQKNFDVTFCFNDNVSSIFTVNRKKYYNVLRTILKDKEVYEGGPDPLVWPAMLKTKKQNDLSWKRLAELYLGSGDVEEEDVSSDWSEGSEDSEEEEDDDEEFDNLVVEEEEEEVSEESEEFEESEEEEEEEEEEDDLGLDWDVSPKKRKYDSDSTDESEPKKVKL